MLKYITLIFITLKKAILYKKGAASVFSITFATVVSGVEEAFDFEFLGISYTFIILAVALIMINFVTGALASRYEQKAIDGWFESDKIAYTVYKFISIGLMLWLAKELHASALSSYLKTSNYFWGSIYSSAMSVISISRTTVFSLICGREYLSIGENLNRRFNKRFYAFTIFEKIFDIIELRFIKKIEKECKK